MVILFRFGALEINRNGMGNDQVTSNSWERNWRYAFSYRKTYLEHLNHRLIKYPHNQFIYSWAFCGIFSVLSLAGIFWASFIRRGSFRIEISVAALAVIWSSFLYEHTLASQAGISLFLTISLLAWSRQKSNTI